MANTCPPSITHEIVTEVSEAKGVPPTELPPLYEVIDPDALNQIHGTMQADPETDVQVTFTYSGYSVAISSEGVAVSEEATSIRPNQSQN